MNLIPKTKEELYTFSDEYIADEIILELRGKIM